MGAVESIERSTATFTEITEPLKEITSKIETALIQMGQTTDKLSTLQEGMEKVVDSINADVSKPSGGYGCLHPTSSHEPMGKP